jgi:hypothetical protein
MVYLQYAFLSPVIEIQVRTHSDLYGCRNKKGGTNRQDDNT